MAPASLWLYRVLIHAVLPVVIPLLWIADRLRRKSRPPFSHRLGRQETPEVSLWIQAVSVGEVELARRLVREIHEHSPGLPILVTATTATGLDLARKCFDDPVVVRPCPLDLPGAVRRVLAAARPQTLVLVETELWPEMMHQAKRHGVPVVIANARLSQTSSARYRRFGALLTALLEPLSLVLARGEDDRQRFAALGVTNERIEIGGNLKYDLEAGDEPLEWREFVLNLAGGRPILVAGSTMDGEERAVVDAVRDLQTGAPFLVLAPRHPERFDRVAQLLNDEGLRVVRRSQWNTATGDADVFLIDTIGELSRAYRFADAAFIGGSLVPTGGHNPLESLVWSVPVVSGPHVFNFSEIYADMFAAGAALRVDEGAALGAAIHQLLADPEDARRRGEIGHRIIVDNRGATARVARSILDSAGLA